MLAATDQCAIDIALFLSISQSSVGTRVGELSLDWFAAEGWLLPDDGDLPLVAAASRAASALRASHSPVAI